MTVVPPAAAPASSARRAGERRRRRIAVLIGVLSVPLAVAAAGYLTWSADDPQATPPPITGTTLPAAPDAPTALVPDGDYGPVCDEIRLAGDPGTPPKLDAVYRLLLDADVSAWVAVAPPGFRPTLRRLEASRGPASVVVAGAPDIATLDQPTKDRLPAGFATDLLALSLLLATECAPA